MNISQKLISSAFALLMAGMPILASADDCGCGDTTPTPSSNSWGHMGGGHSNSGSNAGSNSNSNSNSTSNSRANSNSNSNSSANVNNRSNTTVGTSQTLTNTTVVAQGQYGYQGNNNLNAVSIGMGDGVNCAGAALSVSGYGGTTGGSGYSSVNSYGGQVGLVIPLGSKANNNCNALSSEILMQRQAAFCVSLMNSNVDIDENVAPELYARCRMFKRHEVVVIAPPQPVVETRVVERRVPVYVEHKVVVREPEQCSQNYLHSDMVQDALEAKDLMHHTLGPVSQKHLTRLLNKLHTYCGADEVSRILDDGPNLP